MKAFLVQYHAHPMRYLAKTKLDVCSHPFLAISESHNERYAVGQLKARGTYKRQRLFSVRKIRLEDMHKTCTCRLSCILITQITLPCNYCLANESTIWTRRPLDFRRITATHQSQREQYRYCVSTSRLHTRSDQVQSTARRFYFLPDTIARTRRGHCEACLSSCMSAIAFFESGSADFAPPTHCTASLVHASLQSALDPAVTQIYYG